jgi:hypothetical protein
MKTRLALGAMLACIGILAATATLAETPQDVLTDKLGDQPVTLPNPPGFVEPEGAASAVRDMLQRALPAAYRLIALRVPQDYVDKLRAHDRTASLSRYCTILTYRKYEASGMSPELFEAIKKMLRDQSDKVMKQANVIAADSAERMSKDIGAKTGDATTSLKVGDSTSLGIIEEHPGSFALATVGPVSISSKNLNESGNQVAVVAVALIHGKPVNANFYSDYKSNADLVWAEGQARDWLRRVNELNP